MDEIRCRYCNALIIERAGAPWRYSCRRCDGKESSSGLAVPPTNPKYANWRGRRALAS